MNQPGSYDSSSAGPVPVDMLPPADTNGNGNSLSAGFGRFWIKAKGVPAGIVFALMIVGAMFFVMYRQHQEIDDGIKGLIWVNVQTEEQKAKWSSKLVKPKVIQQMELRQAADR